MSQSETKSAEYKAAKLTRRNAKASLTRSGRALLHRIDNKWSIDEIKATLVNVEKVYNDLVQKHEKFTELVEDDAEFEAEEKWLEECQQNFLSFKSRAKEYIDETLKAKSISLNTNENNIPSTESPNSGQSVHEVEDSSSLEVTQAETPEITESSKMEAPNVREKSQISQMETSQDKEITQAKTYQDSKNSIVQNDSSETCAFKIEKPRMPKFSGDVREYAIFKSDFNHIIGTRYSNRDAITLLRTALTGKPLDMIKGIGSDYKAAWDYLDSVYGDPRFVSDTITQDVMRFKPLKGDEDAGFCDLVHLVRRSFNTLKEVDRPHDMDSNHILAIIEQKMCNEDRKVWAHHLEREKIQSKLADLIDWMNGEMKSRMRAAAPLRTPNKARVNQVTGGVKTKCWICPSNDHWVDQCNKFTTMSSNERLKIVKQNHACYSCLKKAGRDHRAANCSRKRPCTEMINNAPCNKNHHPLLHSSTNIIGMLASTRKSNDALLPVVTAFVVGNKGKREQANILMDSGAQISFIRDDVAKRLKLKGKNVTITMTTVGGLEEELKTKLFKVPIRSMETNSIFTVNAVGIPCISDEITEIQVGEIEKHLGLEKNVLCRGSGTLDVLIGIDHASMHTGEIKQVGNLVARHSPLGWLVFGALRSNPGRVNKVLRVGLSSPVVMNEFWSTEAMGVEIQPCLCETEKLV